MPHSPIFPNAGGYRWVWMSMHCVAAKASWTTLWIWSAVNFSPEAVFPLELISLMGVSFILIRFRDENAQCIFIRSGTSLVFIELVPVRAGAKGFELTPAPPGTKRPR